MWSPVTPRTLTLDSENPDPDLLREAAGVVTAGDLVIFPTETVYGIGTVHGMAGAREKLAAAKERPADQPFTVHIGSLNQLESLVTEIPDRIRHVIDAFFPGPLTVILPDGSDSGVGVRCPANTIARELIQLTGPLIASSANRRGAAPPLNCKDAVESIGSEVGIAIDGGPCKVAEASTIIRFDSRGAFEILRQGLITRSMISKALGEFRVLFVCTGNTCRSPMAEALCKQLIAEREGIPAEELSSLGYHVESAALYSGGGPASDHAVTVMGEMNANAKEHVSRQLSHEMLESADLVLALAPNHLEGIRHACQGENEILDKLFMINPTGVADPVGGPIEIYRSCASEIKNAIVHQWLERIVKP